MIPRIVVRDVVDAEFVVNAIHAYTTAMINEMETDSSADLAAMVELTRYGCALIADITSSCTVSAEEGNDDDQSSEEVHSGAGSTGTNTTGE